MKRVACIYFPDWCIQHRLMSRSRDARRLLIVAGNSTGRGHRVRACCPRAGSSGVRAGMPVAEVLAILDDTIEVAKDDDREDRAALCIEARRAWNFSPLVAIPIETGSPGQRQDPRDGLESLLVNVTGCGHLFGGAHRLVSAMHAAWSGQGDQVRIALAASPGVAWAVSHAAEWLSRPMTPLVVSPGRDIDWMRRLPVEALALPPTVVIRRRASTQSGRVRWAGW